MASVIQKDIMHQRFEARLNPCRWCGERAEFQRERSSYEWQEDIRVCCPQVEEPIYAKPITDSALMDISRHYDRIFKSLMDLTNKWNSRNDGPGFIAGLA